jgi:soluble lytic murein transglycosylase-like protein
MAVASGSGSFLDGWFQPVQGKSPYSVSTALKREQLTVGKLIALRADPTDWPSDRIEELSAYIVSKSREYKISPLLVLSLIHVESSFRPGAVSPRGAVGLMQLMPETAQELASGIGMDLSDPVLLTDPKTNIDLGLRYILYLKSQFGSDKHVLTAYNIGPAALSRLLKNGNQLPLGYYQKVMDAMAVYRRAAGIPQGKSPSQWL